MKLRLYAISLIAIILSAFSAGGENTYSVYVDSLGVMRRDDTNAEVRFYGTNYTVPFAHAYRALGYLGVDRKAAIDRDVYHMSRLGLNAFRLHLWDVELTDSEGNLLQNDHLDLLDYLIAAVEKRGISVVLTAQTDFGNGYPERNTDTGGFSYLYAKCEVHRDPAAIAAQQRYIEALVKHTNPYTGRSYADDRSIIAIEINNEPCHYGEPEKVTEYINTMVAAVRNGGWKKPILYNVSHNGEVVEAYYKADIQGTTYQWYPIGLVSGHERKGNHLPHVDNYDIPFSTLPGFDKMARIVYEFDPADILQSYMYPATVRTFAHEGFQWITQFAYDPIDIAAFNTEYQTHYLNLAYTPRKALGMMIAAEVAKRVPRGADYGTYPADTVFDAFTVSARRDLAIMNTPDKFLHTNNVDIKPVKPSDLRQIAGYGNSPVVRYEGRGAYFLDRVSPGVWRLEVMPDVLYAADPFEKPSLSRQVAHIIHSEHPMTIDLPDLGKDFKVYDRNDGAAAQASEGRFDITPGVYLLSRDGRRADIDWTYVAPETTTAKTMLRHTPKPVVDSTDDLLITAEVFGATEPDSVVIYPAEASFWKDHNHLYRMERTAPYTYTARVSNNIIKDKNGFGYKLVVFSDGTSVTYPGAVPGTPLDWDAPETAGYTTTVHRTGTPMPLLDAAAGLDAAELATIPDTWGRVRFGHERRSPMAPDVIHAGIAPGDDTLKIVLTKQIAGLVTGDFNNNSHIILKFAGKAPEGLTFSLINTDGITFRLSESATSGNEQEGYTLVTYSLDEPSVAPTLLCPAPYPVFLSREFTPDNYDTPLDWTDVEALQLSANGGFDLAGIWIE